MQCAAVGTLRDLLAATEPVGNDQGLRGSVANGGKQEPLTTFD